MRGFLLFASMWLWLTAASAQNVSVDIEAVGRTDVADSVVHDSVKMRRPLVKRVTELCDKVSKLMKNSDDRYVERGFYRGKIMASDKIKQEQITLNVADGSAVKLRSHVANYLGPKIFISPLGFSFSFDISPRKYSEYDDVVRTKIETDVHYYNQFFFLDAYYRKTGGDFNIKSMTLPDVLEATDKPLKMNVDNMGGTSIQWVGADLTLVLNPKRFSMPAAYVSNGRQIRSAGTPVVGFGYSHKKITSNFADQTALMALLAALIMEDENRNQYLSGLRVQAPSLMTFNDFHLTAGYSYNWVFAPNWLFNATATLAPALKQIHVSNDGIAAFGLLEDLKTSADNDEERMLYEDLLDGMAYNKYSTILNIDAMARASLVWNNRRWTGGINCIWNYYHYNAAPAVVKHTTWSANVYFGFNFWRKKAYAKGTPGGRKYFGN